jgi:hypothetical protein
MVKRRTSLTVVTDGSGEIVRATIKTPASPRREIAVRPAKAKPAPRKPKTSR